MTRDQFRLLGSVVKTKGISGEVVIRTKIPTGSINSGQKYIMVKIDGLLVPFFIDSWHNISNSEIVVKFQDIVTRDKAEFFRDKEIWLPRNALNKSLLNQSPEDLSGYKVVDVSEGFIGITQGILDIPENQLLRVDFRDHEILIPLQEGIILKINSVKKEIRVKLPEGFLQI
jgi:16S rRNA processing protein RimM